MPHEFTDELRSILSEIHNGNPCRHGVFLCECMEDCEECFEDALMILVGRRIVGAS